MKLISYLIVLTEFSEPELIKLARAQICFKLMYLAADLKNKNRVWGYGPGGHLLVQLSLRMLPNPLKSLELSKDAGIATYLE